MVSMNGCFGSIVKMADADDDQWLYGDSNPENPEKSNDDTEGTSFDFPGKDVHSLTNPSLPEADDLQPPGVLETPISRPPIAEQFANAEHDAADADLDEEGRLQIDEGIGGEPSEGVAPPPPLPETNGTAAAPGEDQDDEDEDSDDDDVRVTIGDIRTAPQYNSLNIKRGGLLTSAAGLDKGLKQPGRFSIEEFETIGVINGLPAHDFNLDTLEDKPWRKPGADITDYFNYGFNEDTWRSYCERQKRIRIHESCVGLTPLQASMPGSGGDSKHIVGAGLVGQRGKTAGAAGPPPGRRFGGCIDVIGAGGPASRRTTESPPKENIIQVMTADRREYSRKQGFPDMSLPPPVGGMPPPPGFELTTPPGVPPPAITSFPPVGGGPYPGGADFYPAEDPYYQSYEPTQESQWGVQGWETSADVKVVMTLPSHVIPLGGSETSNQDSQDAKEKDKDHLPGGVTIKQEPKERDRERDRDRDRDREKEKERHRERHRHRSRSRSTERRSRKHKSRSRSPGHRSHKKKKSKKSDRVKEESE